MKIVILTTEKHIYANYLLKKLFLNKVEDKDFLILESTKLIDRYSQFAALKRYIKVSGFYYVFLQIIKQYAVRFLWLLGRIFCIKNIESSLVFWKMVVPGDCKIYSCNNINSRRDIELIKDYNPDLILSIFFNQILLSDFLDSFNGKIYNLHPSKLPEYGGVSPTFWVLAENVGYSGISLHKISKEIDRGDIVDQGELKIRENETEHSLYARLTVLGSVLLSAFVRNYSNKNSFRIIKNDSGIYRSFPQKRIVKKFRDGGRKFFTFKELLSNFKDI